MFRLASRVIPSTLSATKAPVASQTRSLFAPTGSVGLPLRPGHPCFLRSFALIPFHLTDIGEGTAEVEIKSWTVKEGDAVESFDPLVEVESDKATVEITSKYKGIVKSIEYAEGDIAKVGTVLCTIEVEGEDEGEVSSSAAPAGGAKEAAAPAAAPAVAPAAVPATGGPVLATPAVRRVARERGIDLSTIAGSGKRGRILKEDVLRGPSTTPAVAAMPTSPSAMAAASAGVPADREEPIRGLKRTMTKVMTEAWTIPQFLYCDEIVCDSLKEVRAQLKPAAADAGVKLTFMPFMIKAASLGLTKFPIINSTLDAARNVIQYKGAHNIGVAMQTPEGLLVPSIKNVQSLSILEIAVELNRLMEAGAAGKLGPADLAGGTFTLSNVGVVGGTYTHPLLVPPQVVIGAVGKMSVVPRYTDSTYTTITPTTIMSVSWSGDHRIVDGVTLASFSNVFKDALENPASMLLTLK
jgi:2-oxoisovalerate dehydrogenase E2 component (dihydrolipoyl transacylase)